ncbi:hypothetical protein [Paenibacillus senegalensis]|uniref:hypothetical protein n=1 Tax=Paenibacillus senegalensis TaxID=1465766 RepID=UPI00028989ED|nr:hypothetical protein [Paenibacillus senegalensis]
MLIKKSAVCLTIFAVLLLWGWQSQQAIQEAQIQEQIWLHPEGVRLLETNEFQPREYVRINSSGNIEGN